MTFDYSCFISYSYGGIVSYAIEHLYEALSCEIESLVDKKIYFDRSYLGGGDIYGETLPRVICRSACMIMIYTPSYFDMSHTFCAREFVAMEILEKIRLQKLGGRISEHWLIIPIILRGGKYLPDFIKKERRFYDFSDYIKPREGQCNIFQTKYARHIAEIANYVYDRYVELDAVCDPDDCDSFKFHTNDELYAWLNEITKIESPVEILPKWG